MRFIAVGVAAFAVLGILDMTHSDLRPDAYEKPISNRCLDVGRGTQEFVFERHDGTREIMQIDACLIRHTKLSEIYGTPDVSGAVK